MNRSNKYFGWVSCILLITTLSLGAANTVYSYRMFSEALHHGGFVLVNLREPSGKLQESVCVPANLLLGAIHLQDGLGYDKAANARALNLALGAKNRTFTFTRKDAYENVKPAYTRQQLTEVHKRMSGLTRTQMKEQLSNPYGEIHDIYARPSGHSYHDTVAHVLLENGILVGADDRTDMLMPLARLQ